MSLTGKGLAEFALTKLGTPYVYGAKGADGKFTQARLDWLAKNYPSMFTASYIKKAKKFIGKACCDCSGLVSWYTGKVLGSYQLYSKASVRGKMADLEKAPIGAVLWRSGHVAVYIGNGYCVEAKGIAYGCVKTKISNTRFTHYLLFDFMEYNTVKVKIKASSNPYKEPTTLVRRGNKGDSVKWVQYELKEAGFKTKVDGLFGRGTLDDLKSFQKSSKISVDGICGPATRKALIAD